MPDATTTLVRFVGFPPPARSIAHIEPTKPPTDVHALLGRVLNMLDSTMGMHPGTRGGNVVWNRSRAPKPGDLVAIVGTMVEPPYAWLEAIEEGGQFGHRYLLTHFCGRQCWWENIEVRAMPCGDRWATSLLKDPDPYFAPAERPVLTATD